MKTEELIKKLNTSSDKTAERVISALIKSGPAVVPLLLAAAKDLTSPRIRKWSLQALGGIGDKRAAPVLVAALKDERMTVRLHALKGLRRMKYKNGLRAIVAMLKDESGGVRVNALYCLMEFEDKAVIPQIQKCLLDEQWYIRQTACIACGQLGAVKAKKKLAELATDDERKAVREAATQAITALPKKPFR